MCERHRRIPCAIYSLSYCNWVFILTVNAAQGIRMSTWLASKTLSWACFSRAKRRLAASILACEFGWRGGFDFEWVFRAPIASSTLIAGAVRLLPMIVMSTIYLTVEGLITVKAAQGNIVHLWSQIIHLSRVGCKGNRCGGREETASSLSFCMGTMH